MHNPLLSIVIANYNTGRYLEQAILSVLDQDFNGSVELIVCDGGSTDNSVEIIRAYSNKIAWWCSEKDGGQSAAFNKGFSHAMGTYLTWLNADDVIMPGALSKVLEKMNHFPSADWFAGGFCQFDAEGKILSCTRVRPLSKLRARTGVLLVYGPSSIFSRKLYERAGGYVDERFHYQMDIELWNRFFHAGVRNYIMIPGYVWGFRRHEDSKTAGKDLGDASTKNNQNLAWKRVCEESKMIRDMYADWRCSLWLRLLTLSPIRQLLSWIDSLVYRNSTYTSLVQ